MQIYPNWFYVQIGNISILPIRLLFVGMAKQNSLFKYNRIREVLEGQGKTQTWLSEKLDMDFVTITRYVNNLRQPRIEILFEIAKALKVNPKELLDS